MAWGPSPPHGAGGPRKGGGAHRPPRPRGGGGEEEGEREWDSVFPRTSVSFPCGKIKARIKGFPFGNPRRVLLGLGETPSRVRTSSFIYVGRG